MAFRSSASLAGGSAANAAVPVPAGAAIDDIAVVGLYIESTATVTPPAGFTQKVDLATSPVAQGRLVVFWKRLAAADSGTWTFTHTSAFRAAASGLWSGRIATGDPFDGTVGTAESVAGVTTLNVSTSPVAANGDAVGFWTNFNGGGAFTQPTNYTERQDVSGVITLDSRDAVVSGSTGNVTATCTITDFMKAFLGVLAAAADSGAVFNQIAQRPPGGIAPTSRRIAWAGTEDVAVSAFTVDQTDSAGLSDAAVVDQSKEFVDSAGMSDAAAVELSKLVAQTDSTGLTDSAVLDQSKAVTDSAGLTDSAAFTQSKVLTDSAGLTDTSLVESGKAIAQTDSAGLTDSQSFSQTRVLSDSTGLTDAASLTASKVITDSTGLTDAASVGILRNLAATDSAGLTDAAVLFRTAVLTDLVGLADAAAFSQLRGYTDSAGITDSATVTTVIPIPPFVPRPSGGFTPRPGSATTPRPSGGTITRAASGLVPRPSSGSTPRP